MTNTTIINKYLSGATTQFLEEIISHGIHNITNDFSNENFDYDGISEEFKTAAEQKLIELTNA